MGGSFEWPWRWGIFSPQKCTYKYFFAHARRNSSMVNIYNVLLQKKFTATYWQYVYQNQIGGLIRQYGRGALEIHVRFFNDDTMYAEIEIGRISFIHFSSYRSCANSYILGVLRTLPNKDYLFLERSMLSGRNRIKDLPEWNSSKLFCTKQVKNLIKYSMVVTNWKTLAIFMFLSVVAHPVKESPFFVLILSMAIVFYVIAPKRY